MSDLVERLRRPITATYEPGFLPVASIAEEANRQRTEAASRISQQDAELERLRRVEEALQQTVDFVVRQAWREDPPNASNKLTDSERLSAIKFYPRIKQRWESEQ